MNDPIPPGARIEAKQLRHLMLVLADIRQAAALASGISQEMCNDFHKSAADNATLAVAYVLVAKLAMASSVQLLSQGPRAPARPVIDAAMRSIFDDPPPFLEIETITVDGEEG